MDFAISSMCSRTSWYSLEMRLDQSSLYRILDNSEMKRLDDITINRPKRSSIFVSGSLDMAMFLDLIHSVPCSYAARPALRISLIFIMSMISLDVLVMTRILDSARHSAWNLGIRDFNSNCDPLLAVQIFSLLALLIDPCSRFALRFDLLLLLGSFFFLCLRISCHPLVFCLCASVHVSQQTWIPQTDRSLFAYRLKAAEADSFDLCAGFALRFYLTQSSTTLWLDMTPCQLDSTTATVPTLVSSRLPGLVLDYATRLLSISSLVADVLDETEKATSTPPKPTRSHLSVSKILFDICLISALRFHGVKTETCRSFSTIAVITCEALRFLSNLPIFFGYATRFLPTLLSLLGLITLELSSMAQKQQTDLSSVPQAKSISIFRFKSSVSYHPL
ncbi:hypothetical protein BDN72DRAFT_152236 [Pluteus cervinus]|uniref:Uncharacterized protein n=1 Tax=Pluteus cervinus TaxID=181527 RepID=A0ACD3B9T5_9AGAR|nr:hypothetical protein BDN72DRAFT_152236 [Pluteus cervinus]